MSKKNIVFIVFAISILLTACNFSLAQDITPPPGYQPPVLSEPEILTGAAPIAAPNPENGRLIYTEKCQACHGPSGLGDGPDSTGLPNEVARIGAANVANLASPLEWYSVILQGNLERFMPPFSGSLSPADVWDVLAYVYTFSADPAPVADGAAVFSETCAACHGLDGSGGEMPGAANLLDAERMVLLSVNDVVQKIATGSGNDEHVFSTVLDAGQIEAAALYVRALTFPLEGEQVAVATLEPTAEPTAEPTEAAAPTDETDEGAAPTEEMAEETEQAVEEPADQPDGLGTITGVVVNGSGGDLPDGLEVSLEVYEAFELVYEEVVPAAADGSYKFENIAIDPDMIYITLVESEGAFFPSAFHMGNQTIGETIDLPITIYDVTNQTDSLLASRIHVFFQFTGEEMVQVIHQVTISNAGTKMVAPERDTEPLVQFSLPEGAVNLIFQSGSIGNPYVQTAAGFADPTPILPGQNTYEILYAYNLPFEGKLDWQWPADLPVGVAVIFVQGDQVKVESDSLLSSGTEAFDQEVFQVFVANDLNAGEMLDLRINTPLFSGGQGSTNYDLLTIALGVIGLALAGFGAWRFFAPVSADDDFELPDHPSQDDVIAAIIALDEAFEAGEMTEKEYQAQRDPLKHELARLIDEEGME